MKLTRASILAFPFCLFSFFAFSSRIYSEQPVSSKEEIPEIVVSANIVAQPKRKTASSIETITHEQIQNARHKTLDEALRHLANVDVVSLGPPGEDSDLRIRGSDRDEVLVMLDGVPLNSLVDGRTNFLNTIPLELVEKIEVLRGSLSVLYGSDAVGGVVNIITKKKPARTSTDDSEKNTKNSEFSLSFEGGSYQTFKETITALGTTGRHDFAGSFSQVNQKGRFPRSRYNESNFFFNYGVDLTEKTRLQSAFFFSHLSQQLPFESLIGNHGVSTEIPFYVVPDKNRQFDKNTFVARLSIEAQPTDWYSIRGTYSYMLDSQFLGNSNRDDSYLIPSLSPSSQFFNSRGQRHSVDLRNSFRWLNKEDFKSQFSVGFAGNFEFLGYSDQPFPGDSATSSPSVFPDPSLGQKGSRQNYSVYAENTFDFKKYLFASAGIRYDRNSTYGSAVSPRFSLVVSIPQTKTKFFGSYSKGFKAPTVNQYFLTLSDGTGFLLSQSLKKETSQSFEAGIEQKLFNNKLKLGATYYQTSYDGLIDGIELVSKARNRGIEATVKWQPTDWLELSSNYTFLDALNQTKNKPLANRPRHRFNVAVDVNPIKPLHFHLDFSAASSRMIPSVLSTESIGEFNLSFFDQFGNPISSPIPANYLLNFAARYEHDLNRRWIKQLVYSVKINNLLNRSYQESAGYPGNNVNFLLGIEAKY